MELTIENERENALIGRKELEVKVTHDSGTPKLSEVRDKISALKSFKMDSFVIRSIVTGYGKQNSIAKIFVYDNPETLMKVEQKHILKRNGLIVEEEEE